MKISFNLFFMLLFTIFVSSQIDLNRCKVNDKQGFAVNILKLTDSLFIQQSYSISTLYVSKINGSQELTILNGSLIGIKLMEIDSLQKHIAIIDYNNTVKIIELKSKNKLNEFDLKNAKVTAAIWYKEKLLLGTKDGVVKVHDFKKNKRDSFNLHEAAIVDFKILNDTLYSISHDKYLKKWIYNNELINLKTINLNKIPTCLDVNKNKIIVGTFNGGLLVVNSKSYVIDSQYYPHKNLITKVKFIDEIRVLSSSFDKTIMIHNLESQKSETLLNSKDYILNFDFNSQKLIYSSRNGQIGFINLECNSNIEFKKLLTTFN